MKFTTASALALMITVIFAGSVPAQDARRASGVAAAKALYASASYEEALAVLSESKHPVDFEQVERYRALCLLALGNEPEAARAIERIVARSPLYTIDPAEVSPRLVDLFRSVRKRALPAAARETYVTAKREFDQRNHEQAADGFTTLLAILNDGDVDMRADGLADLKVLAEGFLSLSRADVASKVAERNVLPVAEPAPPPPAPAPDQPFYSVEDRDVTPPEGIDRRLPAWDPPSQTLRGLEHKGLLDLLIDESGAVETVAILDSVSPFYDHALLKAAERWTYRPAIKDGRAVKYRTVMSIVLRPDSHH